MWGDGTVTLAPGLVHQASLERFWVAWERAGASRSLQGSRSLQEPPETSSSLQKPPGASLQKSPGASRRPQEPPGASRSLQEFPEASRSLPPALLLGAWERAGASRSLQGSRSLQEPPDLFTKHLCGAERVHELPSLQEPPGASRSLQQPPEAPRSLLKSPEASRMNNGKS